MCLIFFALNTHPKYKLVVAGNRDEFYNRKTQPAQFWEDHPLLLAGRDLEAMGTWLGITRSGRFAMLTNYRDLSRIDPNAPSRGALVSDYLTSDVNANEYLNNIAKDGDRYNGFNLIAGTVDSLSYYSNYGQGVSTLTPGFYGISNHLLDTPWPKVVRGKEMIAPLLKRDDLDPEDFFDVLYDSEVAPDSSLPHTGLPLDREKALSSMFIKTQGYGSRCTSVVLVGHDGHVVFAERVFNTESFRHTTRYFEFDITQH